MVSPTVFAVQINFTGESKSSMWKSRLSIIHHQSWSKFSQGSIKMLPMSLGVYATSSFTQKMMGRLKLSSSQTWPATPSQQQKDGPLPRLTALTSFPLVEVLDCLVVLISLVQTRQFKRFSCFLLITKSGFNSN